jgi:crotonobetainyl-CoA:carnitine CoA-transferase CaiB-like acyl-CoA transferase
MAHKHSQMIPQQASGRISGSMRCSDDHWIAFGHLNSPQWVDVLRAFALAELVDDPRFTTAEMRGSHMPQLMNRLRERAATQPAAYWLQRLVEADIPCTLVQDYDILVLSQDDFFCSRKQLKKPADLGSSAKIVCDKMNLTMH